MAVNNSGQYSSVSGVFFGGNGMNDCSFCYAGASADAYPAAGAASDMVFGFNAGMLVITNEGTNDICYAFPALYSKGNTNDSGVVKAGATVLIGPLANKSGLRVRSRNAGQSSNFIVSAI